MTNKMCQALRKLEQEIDAIDSEGFGVGVTLYHGVSLSEFSKEQLILILTVLANQILRK